MMKTDNSIHMPVLINYSLHCKYFETYFFPFISLGSPLKLNLFQAHLWWFDRFHHSCDA